MERCAENWEVLKQKACGLWALTASFLFLGGLPLWMAETCFEMAQLPLAFTLFLLTQKLSTAECQTNQKESAAYQLCLDAKALFLPFCVLIKAGHFQGAQTTVQMAICQVQGELSHG